MGRLKATPLTGVTLKKLRYAVEYMIALDRFTLVIGRPGITKTLALIDFCAQLTRGAVKGELEGTPSTILYITRENTREESIGPRARAARAVESLFLTCDDELQLPDDIEELRSLIFREKAKLVVLDTLGDYVKISLSHQTAAIKTLQPIADLAKEMDVAIVGVLWANKHGKGINAVAGSIGNSGVVRCVIVVGQLSSEEYLIATWKQNDGPERFGWVYSFDVVEADPEGFPGVTAPRIDWDHARRAKAVEVDQAFEAIRLTEDPAIADVLAYMATPMDSWDENPEPMTKWTAEDFRAAGWLPTSELLTVIKEASGKGGTAARKVLNRASAVKLLDRRFSGQGEKFTGWWRITDLGRMWNKEDEEGAIYGWFHTDRRKSKRVVRKRATKSQPPQPKALPPGPGALPKATD
jgi:hypothetical protein